MEIAAARDLLDHAVHMVPKVFNDASAACFGEMLSGLSREHASVFYVYVGTFVGGGIALGSSLYTGDDGAAANIAAMPVRDRSGRVRQLLEVASLWKLEKALVAARRLNDANATAAIQQTWFLDAAHGIAQAIASAAALFQPGLAIIDGPFHDAFREQLVAAVRMELATSCPAGLVAPTVQAGSIGAHATVVGAARLSMSENFLPGWLFA